MFSSETPTFMRWLLLPFLQALFVSGVLTYAWQNFVKKIGVVRFPGGRHRHARPTPMWGGILIAAIIIATILVRSDIVETSQIVAMLLGAFLLLVVGALDDIVDLGWAFQLASHVAAGVLLVWGGGVLSYVNSPFGGAIVLDSFRMTLPHWLCAASACEIPLLGGFVTVVWVVLVINAVNWFDGTDGAAVLVSGTALLAIGSLSLRTDVMQPALAIIAAIAAGTAFGFLPFNIPQAKQFLGTSGATTLGFFVAALAVLAGAKVATAATVLVLPAADMLFVIASRIRAGVSVVKPDNRHVHHWLKARGWSSRAIFILLFFVSALLGVFSVLLPHPIKTIVLVGIFTGVVAWFAIARRPLGREP